MPDTLDKKIALVLLGAALALAPVNSFAQSSGGGGGGGGGGSSSGGSSGGGSAGGGSSAGSASSGSTAGSSVGSGTAGSAGASASRGGSATQGAAGTPGAPQTGTSTIGPGGLRNASPSTTTPGIASPTEQSTQQRAQQLRNSNPSNPSANTTLPPGDDRGRTGDVREPETQNPNSAGLPARSDTNAAEQPNNELSGGGRARQGAVGRTMAECEAAWDTKTHMSKETWRDTCRRTLTDPHL